MSGGQVRGFSYRRPPGTLVRKTQRVNKSRARGAPTAMKGGQQRRAQGGERGGNYELPPLSYQPSALDYPHLHLALRARM